MLPIFEQPLSEMADKIIKFYQKNSARRTGGFTVELTPKQLETLNGDAKRVEIDLLWVLNRQEEDVRITDIELDSIGLAKPLPTRSTSFKLDYSHDGVSQVRRNGRLYLFRSGEYRVDTDGSEEGTSGPTPAARARIHRGTNVSYNPNPDEGKKALTHTKAETDPEAESLVRYLIGGDAGEKSPMLSFRPSAWVRLLIQRSGAYNGKIANLTLKGKTVHYNVNSGSYLTVVVKVRDDAQPYIRCDQLDVNQRGDGQGSFLRTFDKNILKATFRAPSRYGRRAFLGWLVNTNLEEGEDGGIRPEDRVKLKREMSLTLDLMEGPDYIIEPVYESPNYVPVNDKDEPWPACPVGWGFDDWILANQRKGKKPITFYKLDTGPWSGGAGHRLAINEPLGNNQVKLSFERISLMHGEATKISACNNPEVEGSGGDQVMFAWEEDYGIFFDGNGKLNGLRKWEGNYWADASSAFDLDQENRIITFRG